MSSKLRLLAFFGSMIFYKIIHEHKHEHIFRCRGHIFLLVKKHWVHHWNPKTIKNESNLARPTKEIEHLTISWQSDSHLMLWDFKFVLDAFGWSIHTCNTKNGNELAIVHVVDIMEWLTNRYFSFESF